MSLQLIEKKDNVEMVRDQIASLLALETDNQMLLALSVNKNPDDWKLRLFTERSNPWEQWLNNQADLSPIVNVWFDSANYEQRSSNDVERQKTNATFNIDCYGYGESSDVPLGGHLPGDQQAAQTAHKAVRLVRNILMAAENTYLQLRGLVWSRWPQSMALFQPQIATTVQQIVGARLSLEVSFNEFSPQVQSNPLEYVAIDFLRAEDGQIVFEADYQYP